MLFRSVVTGSLLLLQRAITNLVENALAHAVRGDLVVLSAEPSSYCVLTAVANVHAGLTQDEANSFSEVGTGEPWAGIKFGIGLTAARRIAEKLGGRMEIESRPQGWWTGIYLPFESIAGSKAKVDGSSALSE